MGARGPLIVVVDAASREHLPEVPALTADEYLEGAPGSLDAGAVVVNLCRSTQYLSKGNYVSLLAEARDQRVLPDTEEIEEVSNPFAVFRRLREAGVETVDLKVLPGRRRGLPRVIVPRAGADGDSGPEAALLAREDAHGIVRYERGVRTFVDTNAVFGRCLDERFRRAGAAVFRAYGFPLLRIRMVEEDGRWRVGQIQPASLDRLEPAERELLVEELRRGAFAAPSAEPGDEGPPLRIACLWDPDDERAPSSAAALERFRRAAARQGALFEVIGRDDLPRLAEFDALLIRSYTAVDEPSFLFAQTAESLGIPCIDDAASILRCSNKAFLHELFARSGIPTPRTRIVSRKTPQAELDALGLPLVVKLPQGAFSQAVEKAQTREELREALRRGFRRSALLIVQEWRPTPFDWRVGVLDGQVLYVCRYFMARGHWQIAKRSAKGHTRFGRVETLSVGEAPSAVKTLAVQAAALVGRGLYGVDLKEVDEGVLVIEVNDNPTIDVGDEDAVEKDRLYDAIVSHLLRRVEHAARKPWTA